jgi:hypothetical protein
VRRLRVLFVYAGSPSNPGWMTGDPRLKELIEWVPLGIQANGSAQRVLQTLRRLNHPDQFDLVITSEYYIAFAVNTWLWAHRHPLPHAIWGLNQSRRMLTQPIVGWLANKMFARSNLVVTHSRAEQAIFRDVHGIHADKFRFVPWGFDLPHIDARPFRTSDAPYACLVGRNNRDIRSFIAACTEAGIEGVVISSEKDIADLRRQSLEHIELHADLSFERCLACIRDSAFSAVMLNDDQRGAGHITMVAAMMLGKAQVVSDAQVISDYVESPTHALKIPIGDSRAAAQAFRHLMDETGMCQDMARSAQSHALTHYSNSAISGHVRSVVTELTTGHSLPRIDNAPQKTRDE